MTLIRPADPLAPPDPIGSRADLHVSGITGVLTLLLLTVLQDTAFSKTQAPADLGYVVSTAVSYAVSITAGRITRARLLKRSTPPVGPGAPPSGETPGTAMPHV